MQDRYLFRGKVTQDEHIGIRYNKPPIWATGNLHENMCGTMLIIDRNDIVTYKVIPETVGQCTGLHDKNGKLIFEGDILRESENFIVVYDQERAKFKLQHMRVYQYPEWNRGVLMEVIGNIHDNPELLEMRNE